MIFLVEVRGTAAPIKRTLPKSRTASPAPGSGKLFVETPETRGSRRTENHPLEFRLLPDPQGKKLTKPTISNVNIDERQSKICFG